MPRWCQPTHFLHVTFKGALNIGSMVHICIGVIFWYFLITLLDTIIHKSSLSNTSAPLMGVQFFIYLFLFLPLGVLLHRGIKKESVPILQWSGACFLILQIYGGLTQYQYGFVISSFLAVKFPSLEIKSDILLEIGTGFLLTFLYMLSICLFVHQLRSRFYIPPIYPCRVEYYYYPEDTSANITVFHKQVPCQIMHNYQNTAYFVRKEFKPSTSSPGTSKRGGRGRENCAGIANGKISMGNWKRA